MATNINKRFDDLEKEEDIKDAEQLIGKEAVELYKKAEPLAQDLKYFMRGPEEKAKVQKKYDELIEAAEKSSEKYQKEVVEPIAEAMNLTRTNEPVEGVFGSKIPVYKDEEGNKVDPFDTLAPTIEAFKSEPELSNISKGKLNLNKFKPYVESRKNVEELMDDARKKFVIPDDSEVKVTQEPTNKTIPKEAEPLPPQSSTGTGNAYAINSTNSVSVGGDTQYADSIPVRNNDDSYSIPTSRLAVII